MVACSFSCTLQIVAAKVIAHYHNVNVMQSTAALGCQQLRTADDVVDEAQQESRQVRHLRTKAVR
jgi:hypothetical protein